MEGARGIEHPPGLFDRADGFEARGVPSTIAPKMNDRHEKSDRRSNEEESGKGGFLTSARLRAYRIRVVNRSETSGEAEKKPHAFNPSIYVAGLAHLHLLFL